MTPAVIHASVFSHRGLTNSPIILAVAGEYHQRDNGEGKLQAQDHLAED